MQIQIGTLRPLHGHAPPHAHARMMATAAAAQVGVSTEGAGRRAVAAAAHVVGRARQASDGSFGVVTSTSHAPVDFTSLDLAGWNRYGA
eukprot:706626-Pleurochrysis_carterae.AAC.2